MNYTLHLHECLEIESKTYLTSIALSLYQLIDCQLDDDDIM
uniref:Uncharacterized protein n=1 Tax=Tetranychus urticae TaxID=32264 RepID=T1JYX7_TETUR